jgi:choline dehydrogenase
MSPGAKQFDYIVVGGGTAGAVVAARMSEERDTQVLLLEAGPDHPNNIPPELLNASSPVTSGYNWHMDAIVCDGKPVQPTGQQARIDRAFEVAASFLSPGESFRQPSKSGTATPFRYPLAKVMGGGSAINGCLALHARPEDYAVWAASGNNHWNWDGVRPYINRIANEESEKPAFSIQPARIEELTRCQRAFFDACQEMGHSQVDLTEGTEPGVGAIPMSSREGRRVSTSALYLATARNRPNLTIYPNCLVDRLLLQNGNGDLTATGIEAVVDGQRCRFSGGHIIVSAGAINSPTILLRSGIGAAEEVERVNVRPLLNLAGVGKNLQDHPAVSIWAIPKEGSCLAGETIHQLLLQQKSSVSKSICDVQLFMLSAVPVQELPGLHHFIGTGLAMGVSTVVATPRSRGSVGIVEADPLASPRIHLNCLYEPNDLRSMMEGVRSAWRILRREPLAGHTAGFVLWDEKIVDSDVLLERLIRTTVRTVWHPAGTLRMGKQKDRMSVVDQRGKLQGCRNVTVADASIMPAIPSVPTALTCMVIGERIAAHLRGLAA